MIRFNLSIATTERLRRHSLTGRFDLKMVGELIQVSVTEEVHERMMDCRQSGETIEDLLNRLMDHVEKVRPS